MRLVRIDELRGNEVLALPVITASDMLLIQSDTVLKDEYIDKLRDMNIDSVYVKEEQELTASEENSAKKPGMKSFTVEDTYESSKEIVTKVLERHIYKRNNNLKKIGEAAERILNSVLSEPDVLSSVTEIRNISTDMYSHCINVCSLSTIIALRLKMNERQVRNITVGAILHDIGLKYIQVPYINIDISEMSLKDALEYKKHTIYGYSSLQEEDWLSDISKEIILLHHEHIDGTGFPFQQRAEKLHPEVKLVSLCDDFDSLISGIGGKKMKIYEAIEYIRVHAGRIYDATIAAKLLETVALYPVGVEVITNEGEVGVVVRQNKEVTDRPVIRMLKHADGSDYTEFVEKDLLKILTLFIVDTQ